MHSSLQRLNHLFSLATTYVMILFGLISLASFLTIPVFEPGRIDVKDIIVQKGRLNRWGAKQEELASLRFDIRADMTKLLNSYNTKQLFFYLTASYNESIPSTEHSVVVWDRIVTRGDMKDIRAVGKDKRSKGPKRGRGNMRVEDGKNTYQWRNPTGTFKHIPTANLTLHYSLMPYVGILSSGVAATAHGPVTIPEVLKR